MDFLEFSCHLFFHNLISICFEIPTVASMSELIWPLNAPMFSLCFLENVFALFIHTTEIFTLSENYSYNRTNWSSGIFISRVEFGTFYY